MGTEWIIDVLDDLKAFASLNGLPLLADKLDEVTGLARAEMASTRVGAPLRVVGDDTDAGRISARLRAGNRA